MHAEGERFFVGLAGRGGSDEVSILHTNMLLLMPIIRYLPRTTLLPLRRLTKLSLLRPPHPRIPPRFPQPLPPHHNSKTGTGRLVLHTH